MEDGLFPHQRSAADLDGLEEERRLCYVGTTRAMRQLYITYAEQRRLHGVDSYGQPSRFIARDSRGADRGGPAAGSQVVAAGVGGARAALDRWSRTGRARACALGSRVRHGKFGDGVVLNFEGSGPQARIQVNFEQQGTKWLMLSYANLEVV